MKQHSVQSNATHIIQFQYYDCSYTLGCNGWPQQTLKCHMTDHELKHLKLKQPQCLAMYICSMLLYNYFSTV